VQVDHLFAGMKADDPAFGVEPEGYHGYLHTKKEFDPKLQKKDESGVVFSGKIPSQKGSYLDYYKDVVAAIRGEKEVVVKPEESRDGIRLIELARESAQKGVTVPWSDS
jgi:predicted dehydrogenase